MPSEKQKRICPLGHTYYKSTDCPTCPTCEAARRPQSGFLALLAAPARRALEGEGITTLEQLAGYSEKELLSLHGLGPAAIPRLRQVLEEKGLIFRDQL